MIRIVSALSLALFLVSCDNSSSPLESLSTPFAAEHPKAIRSIFTLRDSTTVAVGPVAGISPDAREKVSEAVADALQKLDILATAEAGGGDRLTLIGTVQASGTATTVAWRLTDGTGHAVGQAISTAPVSLEAVNRGEPAALKTLAAAAADRVSPLLQDDAPAETTAATAPQDYRNIVVRPVTGAPGDGREALGLAMAAALTQAKLSVVPSTGDTTKALAVVGTVKLDPPKGGKQHVAINWALMDAAGKQLGVVSQQNDVQPGSLDGRWGDVANAVASAAIPGIVALIAKAQQAAPNS